ncbi:MAG: dihydroorotase [Bacillota bacterium]
MLFELAIKECEIVTSGNRTVSADIWVSEGKIAAITAPGYAPGEASEVIHARGLVALPGIVDEHVHMMDPGHTDREDFTTGTMAAAYGGVTTVIDHHRTVPPVYSLEALRQKQEYLSTRSVVDYGLKGGASPDNVSELSKMWRGGVTGFKLFTCELHGVPAMLLGALFSCLREVASFGGTVLVHAEEDSIVKQNEIELRANGRQDYMSHSEWRSETAELFAIQDVLTIARLTGARVVFAHVSKPDFVRMIYKAKCAKAKVFTETCPHYFYLTTEHLKSRGPWVKCAPSVRSPEDAQGMWRCLAQGLIDTIGSDHCPYPKQDKQAGTENIWMAPNGLPGVETSLRLMLTGVCHGKATLEDVVRTMSTNPAKIWGLYPRKGALLPGTDADIVLVDLKARETLSNEGVVSKCGWTPFEGFEVQGIPIHTILRGKPVMLERQVIGKPGYGQFVPGAGASATHLERRQAP